MQFSLHAGLILRSGVRTFELVRELPDGEWQLEDHATRRPSVVSQAKLLKRIWDKQYHVVLELPVGTEATSESAAMPGPVLDLSELRESDQEEIGRRLDYVKAIEKAHVSRGQRERIQKLIEQVARKRKEAKSPSSSTVMKWVRSYQTAGNSPLALRSGNATRRCRKRVPAVLEALIVRVLREVYFTRARNSLQFALDRITTEAQLLVKQKLIESGQKNVSMATVWRRVQDVDMYRRIAAREGDARARMVCRTTFEGGAASYPLERVEVDHTVLNWVVICDRTGLPLGRPVLTVMIDAYSGYVLGFYVSFYGPGLTSVSGVIRNAVMPKDDLVKGIKLEHAWLGHGLADELVLDNGMEFHSRTFKLMSWELGSNMMYCRVRTPWLKPHVERFFATLNFLSLMRGRVHKRVTNVLNLNPSKDAAIKFSDLVRGLVMFVTDVHPFEINERKLARPYDVFREGLTRCPPAVYPGSWDQLRLISGLSKALTVGPGGVELQGLPYGGGELLGLRERYGKKFRTLVKWDPDDMRCLYVQDPREQSWIESPCRWHDYAAGLSWNQHLMTSSFARKELKMNGALDSLLAAKNRLHDHWMEATSHKTSADAKTAARFSGATSAKVMAPSAQPSAPARPPVAEVEEARSAIEVPDFESFEMA